MYRTKNLRVDVNKYRKESYLYGDCEDNQGCVHYSSLRLDDCIGDRNGKPPFFSPIPSTVLERDDSDIHGRLLSTSIGRFQWEGHDFTKDADDVTFNPSEGGSKVPVLRANFDGIQGDINLAERINNENGELQFHCKYQAKEKESEKSN